MFACFSNKSCDNYNVNSLISTIFIILNIPNLKISGLMYVCDGDESNASDKVNWFTLIM